MTFRFWPKRKPLSTAYEATDLPNFLTKSKRLNTFSQLSDKDKLALKRWAMRPEAFIFRDILLNSMTSTIMANLASSSEGISKDGQAKCERMRGQIAIIVEIRKMLELARRHQPKENNEVAKSEETQEDEGSLE